MNLDILNEHEPDSDDRPLIVTVNLTLHNDPIDDNSHSHKHLVFDRDKSDIFLNNLKSELLPLSRLDNIKYLYQNFPTTLSSSINKLFFEVLGKNKNRRTNPSFDKECKISRRQINKKQK